jgi:hypothetical protein
MDYQPPYLNIEILNSDTKLNQQSLQKLTPWRKDPHQIGGLKLDSEWRGDMKFKMVATAGLSLTLDPMGKMFQNAFSLKPLGELKPSCPGMIIGRSCSGSHLGIPINIKNTKFVKDLPMIDAQFRFNQCNSFREEHISKKVLYL